VIFVKKCMIVVREPAG